MKRQFAIFLTVSLIFVAAGLIYGSQVVADLTVIYSTSADASGTKIVLSPNRVLSSTTSPAQYQLEIDDAQRVVVERLKQLNLRGYYGVVVQDNHLEVTLPDTENMPYIVNIITRVGEVEFIDGGTTPPVGEWVKIKPNAAEEETYQILFVGKEITEIVPPDPNEGEIFYQIELQPAAAERFTRFVETRNNAYVCLVIDKQVINCSKMYHWSGNTLDILPNLSSGTGVSLADIAIFLESGPLSVSLDVVTE